jgi:methyl-accepting chemotaxis protein
MMTDRIGKLRATTELVIGFARGLEKQIGAGTLTRAAAVAQLADAVLAMHFDNGSGYVTFQTHDGLVLVHGLVPSRNGKPAEGRANGVSINTVAWSLLEKSKEAVIFYVAVNPPLMVPASKVAIAIRFDSSTFPPGEPG